MLSTSEFLDNFDADMADIGSLSELTKSDPSQRPIITVDPGQLPWVTDAVEQVILRDYKRHCLYQRGTQLVRVISWAGEDKYVKRSPGAMVLQEATPPMLQDIFGRATDFRKVKQGEPLESGQRIDCPAKVANTYLSRKGLWRLPHLTGVVTAPIMRGWQHFNDFRF